MKRLFAITVVMLLSSAMFFVGVCTAGANVVTKHSKGTWTGKIYVLQNCADPAFKVPPGSPPAMQSINIGKGVMTLTGKSDWFSVSCNVFTSETTMASSGWAIITAANGDAIHLTITGTLDLSTSKWTEEETVVGGTGMYEGATGESSAKGTLTSPTETDTFPFASGIPPSLIQAPASWVGTNEGDFTLKK